MKVSPPSIRPRLVKVSFAVSWVLALLISAPALLSMFCAPMVAPLPALSAVTLVRLPAVVNVRLPTALVIPALLKLSTNWMFKSVLLVTVPSPVKPLAWMLLLPSLMICPAVLVIARVLLSLSVSLSVPFELIRPWLLSMWSLVKPLP